MHKRAVAALLALALLVASCGDDDDDTTAETDSSAETSETETDTEADTETETETDGSEEPTEGSGEGEQAAGSGDFCSGYQELLAGEPTPQAIRELAEIAPEPAKQPLETLATGFEEDPEGFFDTEEFGTAFAELGAAANDECADERLGVTAVDYGFEGIPSELSAGTYGVDFSNDGQEFHEMIVLRKGEGTTQSFEELLGMEEQEAMALVVEAGATFAPPGGQSGGLFDFSEPGEYAAVCFIPVGSTPEAGDQVDGPPHFTAGMISEFTVS